MKSEGSAVKSSLYHIYFSLCISTEQVYSWKKIKAGNSSNLEILQILFHWRYTVKYLKAGQVLWLELS